MRVPTDIVVFNDGGNYKKETVNWIIPTIKFVIAIKKSKTKNKKNEYIKEINTN